MKLLFSLVIAIGLSGCANSSDLRKKESILDLTSKNSAKEVALCIYHKWHDTKPTRWFSAEVVLIGKTPNGYSISSIYSNMIPGLIRTITLVDVTEVNTESATRYYKYSRVEYSYYDHAVMECQ